MKGKIHIIIYAYTHAIFSICRQYIFSSKEKDRDTIIHVLASGKISLPLLLCCSHQHNVL